MTLVSHSAAAKAVLNQTIKPRGDTHASPTTRPTLVQSNSAQTKVSPSWLTRVRDFFVRKKVKKAEARIGPAIHEAIAATKRQNAKSLDSKAKNAILKVPQRKEDASTGSQFIKDISGLPLAQREVAILREVKNGNVPSFMRNLKPVQLNHTDSLGRTHQATAYVTPDYLAIGSDKDFVRIPMTPQTAQKIADLYDGSIPTTKLVDEVHRQSSVKLKPQALTQNRESTSSFVQHDNLINRQAAGTDPSSLRAGHKKDIVNARRAQARPNQVAIYGWHRPAGQPIQPLSTVHHKHYVDYSHGVRLIANQITVNGRKMKLEDLMKDPHLSGLVSHEGPLKARLP